MWLCRYAFFTFYESPKNLLARGYKQRAVDSLNKIAAFNKSPARISIHELCHDDGSLGKAAGNQEKGQVQGKKISSFRRFTNEVSQFGPRRLKPLFATKRMGWTTIMVWFIWVDIQIGEGSRNLH